MRFLLFGSASLLMLLTCSVSAQEDEQTALNEEIDVHPGENNNQMIIRNELSSETSEEAGDITYQFKLGLESRAGSLLEGPYPYVIQDDSGKEIDNNELSEKTDTQHVRFVMADDDEVYWLISLQPDYEFTLSSLPDEYRYEIEPYNRQDFVLENENELSGLITEPTTLEFDLVSYPLTGAVLPDVGGSGSHWLLFSGSSLGLAACVLMIAGQRKNPFQKKI